MEEKNRSVSFQIGETRFDVLSGELGTTISRTRENQAAFLNVGGQLELPIQVWSGATVILKTDTGSRVFIDGAGKMIARSGRQRLELKPS